MEAEVKIQIKGISPVGSNTLQFQEAVNFVAATVERVVKGESGSSQTFDPLTGEPYHPVVFDPKVIESIGAISVSSPHAMAEILTGRFSGEEDGMISVAPIFVDTSMIDDD